MDSLILRCSLSRWTCIHRRWILKGGWIETTTWLPQKWSMMISQSVSSATKVISMYRDWVSNTNLLSKMNMASKISWYGIFQKSCLVLWHKWWSVFQHNSYMHVYGSWMLMNLARIVASLVPSSTFSFVKQSYQILFVLYGKEAARGVVLYRSPTPTKLLLERWTPKRHWLFLKYYVRFQYRL